MSAAGVFKRRSDEILELPVHSATESAGGASRIARRAAPVARRRRAGAGLANPASSRVFRVFRAFHGL
jgi:hypothetical protein